MDSLKDRLLQTLYAALNQFVAAEDMLQPSLNVYVDIHDAKMSLRDIISNIEEGEYDKGAAA